GRRAPPDRARVGEGRVARPPRRRGAGLGVDLVRLRRLSGLRGLPVRRVLRGLLRARVQGFTRRLVGDTSARGAHDVPELGLPDPPAAFRGLPRCTRRLMPEVAQLRLDVHLTRGDRRAALAADVRRGLTSEPKELPAKWLYDERGSALFEEITRLPEYYLTARERTI